MSKRPARPFEGKFAVITGAGRGIGQAMAECFAEAGCALAICARSNLLQRGDEIAQQHSTDVFVSYCDVRDADSVAQFFTAVKTQFGKVDILVNNAGIAAPSGPVASLDVNAWRDVIDTNLTGVFLCTRAALPLMHRGGVVVNNLSVAARQPFAGQAAYVAGKHGAKGFTDTLREELREHGIRVIGLYPGATDTDMWNRFWRDAPRDRMMSPEVIARATLNAITLPENITLEELVLGSTTGKL
ncbi:MAG: SDR family oxidoreductase [Terriglobales bacterium]|jgi:NAD(P)-dependent dehydrogenase (short-subunit alcohol dehydrogenase family)